MLMKSSKSSTPPMLLQLLPSACPCLTMILSGSQTAGSPAHSLASPAHSLASPDNRAKPLSPVPPRPATWHLCRTKATLHPRWVMQRRSRTWTGSKATSARCLELHELHLARRICGFQGKVSPQVQPGTENPPYHGTTYTPRDTSKPFGAKMSHQVQSGADTNTSPRQGTNKLPHSPKIACPAQHSWLTSPQQARPRTPAP